MTQPQEASSSQLTKQTSIDSSQGKQTILLPRVKQDTRMDSSAGNIDPNIMAGGMTPGGGGMGSNMADSPQDDGMGPPDGLGGPTPKRRRVTRACDECRRKKIKCDGKQVFALTKSITHRSPVPIVLSIHTVRPPMFREY